VPRGVQKQVRDLIDGVYEPGRLVAAEPPADYAAMGEKQVAKELKRLEKLMFDHARNLEFEKAAQVRDQLAALRERVFGASAGSNVVPLAKERAA
jgi:excinuclease ABC subunit B